MEKELFRANKEKDRPKPPPPRPKPEPPRPRPGEGEKGWGNDAPSPGGSPTRDKGGRPRNQNSMI